MWDVPIPIRWDSCSPGYWSLPSQQTVTSCACVSTYPKVRFCFCNPWQEESKNQGWILWHSANGYRGRWTSRSEMFHLLPPSRVRTRGWPENCTITAVPPTVGWVARSWKEKGDQSLCKALPGYLTPQMNFLPYSPTQRSIVSPTLNETRYRKCQAPNNANHQEWSDLHKL